MTYTYTPSVPNPPDDPADDVAAMQQNSLSIGGIFPVDHVDFNGTNGGIHNQVTILANQAAPGLTRINSTFGNSTGVGVLYGNFGPGLSSGSSFPYWENAVGSFQLLGAVFGATSGSVVFPGGIIFKWGQTAIPSGSSPLPIPVSFTATGGNFLNNAWVALVSLVCKASGTSSSDNTICVINTTLTTSGFEAQFNGNSGSFPFFTWIAIGN